MSVTAAELLVKITSETTSAEAGLRNVAALLRTLVGATEGAGAGMATMGAKAEAASAQAAMLETKASAAAMQAQNLGVRAEQAAAQADAFAVKAAAAGAGGEAFGLKAQAAAARAQDLGTRAYAAGGQAEYLGTKAAAAGAQAEALAGSTEKAGGKLASLAGTLGITTVATAGLAAGGVALAVAMVGVTRTAGEWQQSMVLLQNNTGLSDAQMIKLKASVLDLSVATGASTDSIAKGFEHAQNILQDYTAAQAVATAATASAVATGADAGMVTNATAQVMKEYNAVVTNAGSATANYAADLQNANEIQNAFHIATQTSNTRLEELVPSTARAIGQAASLGFAYTDVLAVFSTLSKHGFPDAALAGTQVTDMIVHMAHSTPATAKALQDLQDKSGDAGVAAAFNSGNLSARGFIGTLDFLKKAMDDAGLSQADQVAEMYKIIPAMKGGQGAVAALTVGYGDLHAEQTLIVQGAKDNTANQIGLAREINTTAGQTNILKENLHELAVTLGGPLNDGLTVGLQGVNALATGIRDLSTAYSDLTTHIPAVTAGVNDGLLVMAESLPVAGALIQTLANLKAVHDQLAPAISATDTATKAATADMYAWGDAASTAGAQVTAAMNDGLSGAMASADAQTASMATQDELIKAQDKARADSLTKLAADQKTAFTQSLADAKTFYADQATTAKDAATTTKDVAITAAQATLDATKTEIAGEKTAYDDRAQADIKARQEQTQAALQSLAEQNTATNVAAAAVNTAAGVAGSAAQHAADESDTAWKAQVTSIATAASAGENTLHTSNDNLLADAKQTAQGTYNAQATAIADEIKAREEGDARIVHSQELATASAIVGIEAQKTSDLAAIDEQVRAHELASAADIRAIESEKTAALRAVDEETAAYAKQENDRLKLIDANAAARIAALTAGIDAEKTALEQQKAVQQLTKSDGAAAGGLLSQYFAADNTGQSDKAKSIAAELSKINQQTADEMAQYLLQRDEKTTTAQIDAIHQQTQAQKDGITQQIADFKAAEADKKQAINDGAASQKQTLTDELASFKYTESQKKIEITATADAQIKSDEKALTDFKWTMAQNLQSFKDTEAEKLEADKTTLAALLANIAMEQTAENARHADALAKIAERAKADIAAIELLAQKRHDDYTAAAAERAADYTAASAQRAADYTAAQKAINGKSAADIGAMQLAQKQADASYAARTLAADKHFKDQQGQIDLTYKQDVNAIQDGLKQHNAALDARKNHMDTYTIATDQSWQQLIQDAQAYAAAIGGIGTPTAAGGFHAPGKGPLSGPQVTAADFPTSGSVHDIFMGTYNQPGQDPAAIWANQANQNGSGAGGPGAIAALMGSSDVVAKSDYFMRGGHQSDFGTGSNTLCEGWVAMLEGRDPQATAYDAAQQRMAAHQMHFDMPPPAGAEIYYGPNPNNENDGHVAIALGNGMQRGVTSSGIEDDSTANWAAYVAPFLGWVPAHTPMYDQGGIVPGAYGQPSLAIVHGGERYLGLGGQRNDLAGAGVVNHYHITVTGNSLLGHEPQVAQELWRLVEPYSRQQSSYSNR